MCPSSHLFFRPGCILLLLWSFVSSTVALLNVSETSTELVISNNRLYAAVKKSSGGIYALILDGQDLLGEGTGPYLDCYCIPSGAYTPGRITPKYRLITGADRTGTTFGGIVMSETYPPTNQTLEQYWFLRDGETGLHTFSRITYFNNTTPFLRNLQEFRTLFRPNAPLWTDLSTNERHFAPLPSSATLSKSLVIQDATWYLGNFPNEPYVVEEADFFTKYTFSDVFRDDLVHGMYSNGTYSNDGSTFGAWLVLNTRESYYGGPTHSDLMVDGIVYNYIVSNHHGAPTPNITHGFDRTFGPQYFYFNKGNASTTMQELRQDALQYASPTWNNEFYDAIAPYVPNYVPTSGRTKFKTQVTLPKGAARPLAILSENRVDYQQNVLDAKSYQYWVDIDSQGYGEIPNVVAGIYRLTIYADGIFGEYIQDDVIVSPTKGTALQVEWVEDSAGTELWRIGIPDRSSGEYKHGYEPDTSKPLHPESYRIYWGKWDFPTDFPEGVVFKIGESEEAKDLNYVHWSVFGPNYFRSKPYYQKVSNWTILFELAEEQLQSKSEATFTVQLAGAKTASGNTDVFNASEPYANLPYTVAVNNHELPTWYIPYNASSSCAVRSSVTCHTVHYTFIFDAKYLVVGANEFVLSLPVNATDYESAILPGTTYVQYDALRLEVQ